MIKHRAGYLWSSDLSRRLYGREDRPELVRECVTYLKRSHRVRPRSEVPSSPSHRKFLQALITARVRTAVGSRPELRELEDRIRGQEERLERQAGAIDRLLAFVPRREPPVPARRMEEIIGLVSSAVATYFEDADVEVSVEVAHETDLDTTAAHRITVCVAEGVELGTKDLLDLEDHLNEQLIESTTPSEGMALTLEVALGRDVRRA